MAFSKTGLGTRIGVVELTPPPVPTKPDPQPVDVSKQAEQVKPVQEQAVPKAR